MDPIWTGQAVDMLGALTGVLLFILAGAWALRRLQFNHHGRQDLRVVSVLPLSSKERIVLLQAGDEQVLMGISPAGIQHLHTLTTPLSPDPSAESATKGNRSPFAALLKQYTSRGES